jgi:hypothetical protein
MNFKIFPCFHETQNPTYSWKWLVSKYVIYALESTDNNICEEYDEAEFAVQIRTVYVGNGEYVTRIRYIYILWKPAEASPSDQLNAWNFPM